MSDHDHPFWTHVVKGLKTGADMLVDLGALYVIGWVVTSGNLDAATLQVVCGAIASVAVGKRYMDAKKASEQSNHPAQETSKQA